MTFTKKDLKPLFVIERRNGSKKLLINRVSFNYPEGTLYMYDQGMGCQQIYDYYDEDLVTTSSEHEKDVMKVWGWSSEPSEALTLDTTHRKLLWTRKTKKPLFKLDDTVEVINNELAFMKNVGRISTISAIDLDDFPIPTGDGFIYTVQFRGIETDSSYSCDLKLVEVKEMNLSDIQKELGYKVKIVE